MRDNFFHKNAFILFLIVVLVFSNAFNFQWNGLSSNRLVIEDDDVPHDSLYYRYHAIKDSINYVERLKKEELCNTGDYAGYASIGVSKVDINFYRGVAKYTKDFRYYIALSGYRLMTNAEYFQKNGKYFISYTNREKNEKGQYDFTPGVTQIPVRYVRDREDDGNRVPSLPGSVFIPVTAEIYRLVKITGVILVLLNVLVTYYVVLRMSIKILVRISRGDPFNARNIVNLQTIGWYLIALGALHTLLPVIAYWIFSGLIPREIIFPYEEHLTAYRWDFIAGLVMFLIAKAITRGYELEKEKAALI